MVRAILLVLALCLSSAGGLRAHVGPVESQRPLLVKVRLCTVFPFDEYEGLFRGPTGEFWFKGMHADESWETSKPRDADAVLHPGPEVPPFLRIGVNSRKSSCLDPSEEGSRYPFCKGLILFEHLQCHGVHPFRVQMEIWEDDSDSETMAAVRKLLEQGAGFALGTQDEIAATLVSTLTGWTGIDEWLESLDAAVREEIVSVIGEDATAIAGAAVGVALSRTRDQAYGEVDERLRKLSEPARGKLDELAAGIGLSDLTLKQLAGAKQAALDWILDSLIDVVIGAGPDFVGRIDEPLFFGRGPASLVKTSGSASELVNTKQSDVHGRVGTAVELRLDWLRSVDQGECEVGGEATAPAEAAAAVHEVAAGSRLSYPDVVSVGEITFGSVVDPDGEPVSGVAIESGTQISVTDDAGRFYVLPASPGEDPPPVGPLRSTEADAILESVTPEAAPGPGVSGGRWPRIDSGPRFVWWSDFRIEGPGLTCSPVAETKVSIGGREARVLACDGLGGWTVQVPGGLAPGPVEIVASVDGQESAPVTAESIALEMSLAPRTVRRGQRGVATLRVHGTREPVPLRVENRAPERVILVGGDVQTVETSGGAENLVRLRYEGRKVGEFVLNVRVAR